MNESHADQLMDFLLVENSSNQRMIAHSVQRIDKSFVFENRVYTPIEHESFILNNMKKTPWAVNHSQNPSNQLMLSTVAEDTSGQMVNTTQAQVMTEP